MNIKVDPNAWFHAKPAPADRSLEGDLAVYRRALGQAAVGKSYGAQPTPAVNGVAAAAVAAVAASTPDAKIPPENARAPEADLGLEQMAKRAAACIAGVNQSWEKKS